MGATLGEAQAKGSGRGSGVGMNKKGDTNQRDIYKVGWEERDREREQGGQYSRPYAWEAGGGIW